MSSRSTNALERDTSYYLPADGAAEDEAFEDASVGLDRVVSFLKLKMDESKATRSVERVLRLSKAPENVLELHDLELD